MEPDLHVVDPPGVSCLTMVRPHPSDPIPQYGRHLESGFVAAAHKSLVVIYVTRYSGWYLVLDLASSSPRSFTIPGIAYPDSYRCAGPGATVITPLHPGAFVLAELLLSLRCPIKGLSSVMLCFWNSHSSSWDKKAGDLPAQVCHVWEVHMSFPVQSRNLLCWHRRWQIHLPRDLIYTSTARGPFPDDGYHVLPPFFSVTAWRSRGMPSSSSPS
uniref:DUF1618 domain-containing protein n=1 Tax=Setaria viridis TaxID=4556 RepID=A0A4U6WFV3_SETVI|nr:hypothetical protein SEVIR_1G005100v2 [Setaria viridis]